MKKIQVYADLQKYNSSLLEMRVDQAAKTPVLFNPIPQQLNKVHILFILLILYYLPFTIVLDKIARSLQFFS